MTSYNEGHEKYFNKQKKKKEKINASNAKSESQLAPQVSCTNLFLYSLCASRFFLCSPCRNCFFVHTVEIVFSYANIL
jgi:hypothetical protein